MADISPGQFPTSPSFQSVNFKINTPTITSETTSGKMRRVAQGHSYYSFEVRYPSVTQTDVGRVTGFLSQALGQMYSFEIVLPRISTPVAPDHASANNVATISSTIASGQKYAPLSNCGANKTILYAGDMFRFKNHSKVYMCTTDCTSDGSGVANLIFSGACVSSVPSGTKLWTSDVPFTVIVSDPEQEFEVSAGGITTLSINMREVW